MLLFRSEEHLESWLAQRQVERGAAFTLEQQWQLASVWYSTRLHRDWRRRSLEEAQAVFTDIGLTGDFWALAQ